MCLLMTVFILLPDNRYVSYSADGFRPMGGVNYCLDWEGRPGSCPHSKLGNRHLKRAICAPYWESSQPAHLCYSVRERGCSQRSVGHSVSGKTRNQQGSDTVSSVHVVNTLKTVPPPTRSFLKSKTQMGHLQHFPPRGWMMAQGRFSSSRMAARVASGSAVPQQRPQTS